MSETSFTFSCDILDKLLKFPWTLVSFWWRREKTKIHTMCWALLFLPRKCPLLIFTLSHQYSISWLYRVQPVFLAPSWEIPICQNTSQTRNYVINHCVKCFPMEWTLVWNKPVWAREDRKVRESIHYATF